jgi:hypothetical protein
MGRNKRGDRNVRPALERLEPRKLLATFFGPNGKRINFKDLRHLVLQAANNVPLQDRRIEYTTPEGTRVTVTLYGFGTLKGTTVDSGGGLHLVYNNTDSNSKIIGLVSGGDGRAPLVSLSDADVPPTSTSATGSQAIDGVNLRFFDLVSGGAINMMGGASYLFLRSIAPNAQIHIHDLPTSALTANVISNTAAGRTANTVAQAAATAQSTANAAIGGTGGSAVVGGTTGGAVASGVAAPTAKNQPAPGVAIEIGGLVGGAALSTPVLQDSQIFGYDPVANTLIRFDTQTGAPLQTIPLPGTGTNIAGVGLARNNGHLVALVGSGQTILAFDVKTGSPVGSFSTANLASLGLNTVDGIGSTDTRTVVTDSQAGTLGLAEIIDVSASLASGQAVPVGNPFAPQREFEFSGGATGVAGSDLIYSAGAAHFDVFQPDLTQLGIISFTTSIPIKESARVPVPGVGTPFINAGPPGAARSNPIQALGSVATNLALDAGVVNGVNVVNLFTPGTTSLTAAGTFTLNDLNRLAGLSESFHPELFDAALIDVTGNLQHFTAPAAQGAVINVSSSANLVAIGEATDLAVIGHPLLHVAIPVRRNVELLSTAARGVRGTGTRAGVAIISGLRTIGPLTLP